jgi:hypothetical protein
MHNLEKHMAIVLGACTLIMVLNIIAVTTGVADQYYSQLTEWLNTVTSLPD